MSLRSAKMIMLALTLVPALIFSNSVSTAGEPRIARPHSVPTPVSGEPRIPDQQMKAASLALCSKPVAERSGGWACADRAALVARPASIPATTPSHCNTGGCWYRYTASHVEYVSTGVAYGYGSELLGTSYMHLIWTFSGIATRETANNRNTGSTRVVDWEGALFNGGHNVEGSVIHECSSVAGPSTVGANVETHSPANYCSLSDNHNYDHHMLGQYIWSVSGIPGAYYIYGLSVVSHSPTLNGSTYTFDSVDILPADPYGSGYIG